MAPTERWNDKALDGLEKRVDKVERDAEEARDLEERRVRNLHSRFDDLVVRFERFADALTVEKKDGTVAPAPAALDWKLLLGLFTALLTGFAAPIVVVVIANH